MSQTEAELRLTAAAADALAARQLTRTLDTLTALLKMIDPVTEKMAALEDTAVLDKLHARIMGAVGELEESAYFSEPAAFANSSLGSLTDSRDLQNSNMR